MTYSQPLIDLLLRGYRWFEDALLSRLEAAGWPELTRAHSLVFAHLDLDGTRASELARRIGISRQAVHQTIEELVELKLVELVPDPVSRRAKLVVLTPRGRRTVRDATAIFSALEDELAREIGPRNVTALRRALEANWGPPPAAETARHGVATRRGPLPPTPADHHARSSRRGPGGRG